IESKQLDQALMIYRRAEDYALDSLEVLAGSFTRLTIVNFVLRQYEQAEIWCERLLLVFKTQYGEEAARLVPVLNLLATIKYLLKKFGDAQSLFNDGLILQTDLGMENSDSGVIDSLKGLGIALCSQGKRKHGQLYCKLAEAGLAGNLDKSSVASEVFDLALRHCQANNFDIAHTICHQSIEEYQFRGSLDPASTLVLLLELLKYIGMDKGVDVIEDRV
ncbi:MAG: tetratricopeptide repeat protein, partial [Candidatus Obscuribacterales bacterium]|nr:tetratricopeptide repeat protein [Candidatus Obscuribacterales bacterium]